MNYYPKPVSLSAGVKIIEEMKKNICGIFIGNKIETSGFFCKIPFPDDEHSIQILITNYQNNELFKKEKEIILLLENEKTPKHLQLENRIIYTNEEYNITILEIKDDKE